MFLKCVNVKQGNISHLSESEGCEFGLVFIFWTSGMQAVEAGMVAVAAGMVVQTGGAIYKKKVFPERGGQYIKKRFSPMRGANIYDV